MSKYCIENNIQLFRTIILLRKFDIKHERIWIKIKIEIADSLLIVKINSIYGMSNIINIRTINDLNNIFSKKKKIINGINTFYVLQCTF